MRNLKSREIHLKSRPHGMPTQANFELAEVGVPEPKEGEALVRIQRVGICGTDISGFLGKMPFFSYPRIPVHELGVKVVERIAHSAPNNPLGIDVNNGRQDFGYRQHRGLSRRIALCESARARCHGEQQQCYSSERQPCSGGL